MPLSCLRYAAAFRDRRVCWGPYQRTKDGQIYVWNNYPRPGDEATWSGSRDPDGYAIGVGTLTWYKRGTVISSYSGQMVRGKLDGPVTNVDASGKTFHGTFVNGSRSADWAIGPAPVTDQRETPTPGNNVQQPVTPLAVEASPQASVASTSSPPSALDPAVKSRIIADFKEQTQSVLSRVGDATGNFHEINRLDSVAKLSPPLSESIVSLVDRARDFRAKLGYETALRECRSETETVDALAIVDQFTRSIAANDASEAGSKVAEFLKANPAPSADNQKSLWRYFESIRLLCARSEKDADTHIRRAESFASAGKTSDAIREYQEAYRIFPNPATGEKIRRLQDDSLGL